MFSIVIEGKSARESALKLVSLTKNRGVIRNKESHKNDRAGSRLLDLVEIVDFFGKTAPIVVSFSGTVTLAYTIWKWRRELSSEEVTIAKVNDDAPEEMTVYKNTAVEEIKKFIEEEE